MSDYLERVNARIRKLYPDATPDDALMMLENPELYPKVWGDSEVASVRQ